MSRNFDELGWIWIFHRFTQTKIRDSFKQGVWNLHKTIVDVRVEFKFQSFDWREVWSIHIDNV